jgi:predicted glutamine amidotransferase
MCIIASIKSNQQISKSTLKRCWNNNPHGGGFMFTDGKKIHVYKEMSSFKRYYNTFLEKRQQYPESNFVCHFRISTHGKINDTNCHPFKVNDKLGFVHNGIIRNAPVSAEYSDTYMFNVTILQTLPSNFTSNVAMLTLIKEYIGSGSKLCFLSADNKLTYVNESAGQYDENGVWFSNGGYKEVKYYDAGGVRVGSYGQTWGNDYKPSNTNSHVKQSSIGFASAVIPNVANNKNVGSKVNNINWNERLKSDTKVESDVFTYFSKSYEECCCFCDKNLSTYTEKNNGVCFHCEDRYSKEYSL